MGPLRRCPTVRKCGKGFELARFDRRSDGCVKCSYCKKVCPKLKCKVPECEGMTMLHYPIVNGCRTCGVCKVRCPMSKVICRVSSCPAGEVLVWPKKNKYGCSHGCPHCKKKKRVNRTDIRPPRQLPSHDLEASLAVQKSDGDD